MKALINGVLYVMKAAILMVEAKNMNAFSGYVSVRLFKSYNGKWFQTVNPVKENRQQKISNWVSAKTAKRWLEIHAYDLPVEVYFGISKNQLNPEHQIKAIKNIELAQIF